MEATMTQTTRVLLHDVYVDYCEAKDKLYQTCINMIENELFRKCSTLWISDEAQAMFKTDVICVFHQSTYPYALMCKCDNQVEDVSLYQLPMEDLAAVAMIATNYKLKFKR